MCAATPPTDLKRQDCVGLINWFTEDRNLLVVAVDVRFRFGEYTQLLGMLLTRPGELRDWGGLPLVVYQVTRSGTRPRAPRGLGPRLYQYALYVAGLDVPQGVLQPDDPITTSAAAAKVWRVFCERDWCLGVHDDPYEDWYAYNGDRATTEQLQLAEARGADWLEEIPGHEDEIEAFLMRSAFATFAAAMGR